MTTRPHTPHAPRSPRMHTLRAASLAVAVAGLAPLHGGCLLLAGALANGEPEGFIEGDDVRLDLPAGVQHRAGDGDDGEDAPIRGDVYRLVDRTITDTNTWVTRSVEGVAAIYGALDGQRPTSRADGWRIYGPVDDDRGRPLAWQAKLREEGATKRFEFYVGPRGATDDDKLDLLLAGDLEIDGDRRRGGLRLDFDTIEAYPALKGDESALHSFAGAIRVDFERDTATEEKTITLDFEDFEVLYSGYLDDSSFFSDERYAYRAAADGAGDFHLALYGAWDDHGWSGPEVERMVLDMAWDPEGAGRARGQILEVDGVGDLKHGDLQLDECFVADGWLTWRALTAAYAHEAPGYSFGDEATCTLDLAALPGG